MSTSEFQDPQTSRAWQRAVSDELIDGVGSVVVEFFDVGRSRRWSWWDRPEASELLAAASRSDRVFDAVVIGEYERAFHGDQFREVVSRLNELGVAVWLPEAGGPVELDSPVHQALMVLLGAPAQREVARARQRVLAAMRVQNSQQGRFLGGRPPYGYRWSTVVHIRMLGTVGGGGGCRCWRLIRSLRRGCGGCSANVWVVVR
nr:recombinase family protein [Lentzea atacamensis]